MSKYPMRLKHPWKPRTYEIVHDKARLDTLTEQGYTEAPLTRLETQAGEALAPVGATTGPTRAGSRATATPGPAGTTSPTAAPTGGSTPSGAGSTTTTGTN